MPTPFVAPITAVERSTVRVLAFTATAALLVCLTLQVWRPFFFLTNDNLTQTLPAMVEIARNIGEGKPALVSASLFGGGYNWSTDASFFILISPLLPLLSPLARSDWYFSVVDVITTFEFVVVAMSFAFAALWLRRRHDLALGNGIIVVASMSYTFCPLMLLFGSSWMGFINAQAAWPLVFIALQFRSAWRAIALLFAAFAFSLFGGNPHPFVFLLLGSGGWALYFSARSRSFRPVVCFAASLVPILALVWLLFDAGGGSALAADNVRAFSAAKASNLNVPPLFLATSFLVGPVAGRLGGPSEIFGAGWIWSAAIGYSLVNLPTLVSLLRGGRPRACSVALFVAIAIVIFLVWRPGWLANLFAVVPVLRSTRWPFRELIVLVFFVHLLFILNYRPLPRPWSFVVWLAALLPLGYLATAGPPSMGLHELSRRLILTGAADAYWREIRPTLGARPNLVCVDFSPVDTATELVPHPLLPSHNFAALFGLVNVAGNSPSSPLLRDRTRLLPPR